MSSELPSPHLGPHSLTHPLVYVKSMNMVDATCSTTCDEVAYGHHTGHKH